MAATAVERARGAVRAELAIAAAAAARRWTAGLAIRAPAGGGEKSIGTAAAAKWL
jgi:hypothetical protein